MTICSPFCPFVRDCSFDCPAPGGDPQATLVFAGEDGSGDVTDTARDGRMSNESGPRDVGASEGLAGTGLRSSDMATIPPPSPLVNPGGP